MDIRKIQKTGGSSYIVSLPKKWAKEQGIEKLDNSGEKAQVGIIERTDGTLIITPKIGGEQEQKFKDINVDDITDERLLFRILVGTYIMGYNVINITSKSRLDVGITKTVKSFIDDSIGLEIIQENQNSLKIKDLLNPADLSFNDWIERISNLVKNRFIDALVSLKDGDEEIANSVINRDNEVNRLRWLIARQHNIFSKNLILAEKLEMDQKKIADYSSISRIIERVGDHAVHVAKNNLILIDKKIKPDLIERIQKNGNGAVKIFTRSVKAFFDQDIHEANRIIEDTADIISNCEQIGNLGLELESEAAIAVNAIAESIRRCVEYSTDLGEYIINYVIDEG
ncbi:MAG: PhoU domain-containing protein [Candidatus Hodarchaeota archaeon]